MIVTIGSCIYLVDCVLGNKVKYTLISQKEPKKIGQSENDARFSKSIEYDRILDSLCEQLQQSSISCVDKTVDIPRSSSNAYKISRNSTKLQFQNNQDSEKYDLRTFLEDSFFGFEDLDLGTFGDISRANQICADAVCMCWVLRLCTKNEEQRQIAQRQFVNLKACQSEFVARLTGSYKPTSSEDPSLYLVLEDLPLGTLADYHFWDYNSVSGHVMKYTIASVVSGVNFIHNGGVIFLGVTPQHIGIDRAGRIKLFDFGWSHQVDERPWDQAGYIGWSRAPEILAKKKYTKSVDSFAIGILSFFLHFDRSPFEEEDNIIEEFSEEEYNDHACRLTESCDLIIPHQVRYLPDLARDFILSCTRSDPYERFNPCAYEQPGHLWLEGYNEKDVISMESPLLPLINKVKPDLFKEEFEPDSDISNHWSELSTPRSCPEDIYFSARDLTDRCFDDTSSNQLHRAQKESNAISPKVIRSSKSFTMESILFGAAAGCSP